MGEHPAGILEQEMEVVGEQAEGVYSNAGVEADGGVNRQEDEPIDGGGIERGAIDIAIRHVMETIGGRSPGPLSISGESRHAP